MAIVAQSAVALRVRPEWRSQGGESAVANNSLNQMWVLGVTCSSFHEFSSSSFHISDPCGLSLFFSLALLPLCRALRCCPRLCVRPHA